MIRHSIQLASNQRQRAAKKAAAAGAATKSSVLMVLSKFKVYMHHLSCYPKVAYLPLLFVACGVYGYHSVRAEPVPCPPAAAQEENPFSDFKSLKKYLRACLTNIVVDIVAGKQVQKEGLSYLERMFKAKQVHSSLITLLKGGVKDSRFVDQSKRFGIDWIQYTITSAESKTTLKDLVSATFVRDRRVQQQGADLCKWFVVQPRSKEYTKEICQKACLRTETFDAMINQLKTGGSLASRSQEARQGLNAAFLSTMAQPDVSSGIMSKLVYRPLANTFTLGLYSYIASAEAAL